MGNFVKGAVLGAAAVMLCNYLFNTEEGKATCKKVKNSFKETMDDLKSDLNELMKMPAEKTSAATEQDVDGAE